MYGVVGANCDAFPEGQFNESLFKWAFGVLHARTFAPLQADTIALVPLIDLSTHDAAAGGWQKGTGRASWAVARLLSLSCRRLRDEVFRTKSR